MWIVLGIIIMAVCAAVGQTPFEQESGVEGVIMIGPVRAGPISADAPASKPLANATFTVANEKGVVRSFITDEYGWFRVLLPPGHYKISLKGKKGGPGRFGPFEIDVAPGKWTKVHWECDSGIR